MRTTRRHHASPSPSTQSVGGWRGAEDPILTLCRKAHPRYKGHDIHIVAFTEDIPIETDYPYQNWVAVHLHDGRTAQVPRWTRTSIPGGHRHLAFVLWFRNEIRDFGLRVFVHPVTLTRSLPEHASLTYPDRLTLWVCAYYVPDRVEHVVTEVFEVPILSYQESCVRLIEHGHLTIQGEITPKGETSISRYWDSLCLQWA